MATAKRKTSAGTKKKAAASKAPAAKQTGGSVAASWARLEAWFAAKHPDLNLKLRPPATATQIADAEKKLGVKLPADFVASASVHDGQENEPSVMLWPFGQRLGSLQALSQCWKDDRGSYDKKDEEGRFDWLSTDKRVRQVHFHPKHIPFAGSSYWDYSRLLFDFVPGPSGTSGQVIVRDDIEFEYLAPSFGALLETIVTGLEEGTMRVTKTSASKYELEYLGKTKKKVVSPREYFAKAADRSK